MKGFNSEALAAYAGLYARHHAGNPAKFYQLLKTSLNTKVKQLHKHILIDEEIRLKPSN
jgi:hypothetical protein